MAKELGAPNGILGPALTSTTTTTTTAVTSTTANGGLVTSNGIGPPTTTSKVPPTPSLGGIGKTGKPPAPAPGSVGLNATANERVQNYINNLEIDGPETLRYRNYLKLDFLNLGAVCYARPQTV